ncbi:MAG TPA: 7-cyano-7-deazaguanine synthase QueC [Nitrospirae bacterium]|nr:7-cyano-7-deazaguanine synthase [bacterium BMS3Abin10]GBE38759.1 7-cyano-7-deazaguanine synthase [bacterium BMS3Bbin08]HDH00447.1 7-cyano-7-deazaguanine synthase QueC [Nitrospirota bacterium]HDH50642.1 7-cyano-7-deazaguanine synthase QueC [Nitrospirota bacterium]
MKRAVVLLSGGIDSTTSLAIAKAEGFGIYAISFDYGQRHSIELSSAKQCAAYFDVKKHIVISFDLREIGGSALTSDIEVPKVSLGKTTHDEKEVEKIRSWEDKNSQPLNLSASQLPEAQPDIPVTYVPARNTIFLSFALAFAESIGSENIFIGANAVDYSGYPDCRPEFIKAFESMANLATKASVEGRARFLIHAPLITLTKAEIIKKGAELGVDHSLTWSCYDPQPATEDEKMRRCEDKQSQPPNFLASELLKYVPCMRCDSCILRARGFKEAGITDPLILK